MVKKGVAKKEQKEIFSDNISLELDSYMDIFSVFDPRPYSQKALSNDFITECKRAAVDKPKQDLELRFLLPKKLRKVSDEVVIRKRLKEHFNKHYLEKHSEVNSIKKEGIIWFFIGVILMLLSATFLQVTNSTFLQKLLFVIFEPAGWFSCWEGLGKVFITSKEKVPDLPFYEKMKNAKINFYND